VRTGTESGKLAVTEAAAWAGSANATYAGTAAGGQTDWGRAVSQPDLISGLRRRFDADWATARPWKRPLPPTDSALSP
jgi:hypothetical protein